LAKHITCIYAYTYGHDNVAYGHAYTYGHDNVAYGHAYTCTDRTIFGYG